LCWHVFLLYAKIVWFILMLREGHFMKSIQVHEFGDADKLVYDDVPMPEPGAGQIRVKVEAVGLNFVEIYHRKGLYPKSLPFIPGSEFAGIVDAIGEGVTTFKVGDRVATDGGSNAYAEFALAPASKVFRLPDGVTTQQGAGLLLQGITAHYLTHSTYPLKPGDTALVHAAAGGAGSLLVQVAKRRGARVIGTVSTEEKATLARKAGADEVILYSKDDFEEATKRLTDGKGVEVVYDSVGKTTFDKSLNCLKPRGYMVLFGQSSGPVPPVDPQILNRKGSLFLTRPTIAHYTLTEEELRWRGNDLLNWLVAGELSVRIDQTFPLKDAGAAHRYMEEGKTKGKVLLIP
jgi:NADPH2:quinone reductase